MTKIALQIAQVDGADVGEASVGEGEMRAERPHGKQYWRSLAEWAGEEEAASGLGCQGGGSETTSTGETPVPPRETDEFAPGASHWPANLSRRRFLQLSAASMALAGLHGCTRQPEETIVPYVRQPEHVVPGRPLQYATALTSGAYATGVLVESHEGRPTKIEGNPDHPASLGATDAVTQAQVLSLYDPDRSQAVRHRGRFSSWNACFAALDESMKQWRDAEGEGLFVLTGSVTSPTLADEMRQLTEQYPKARWHQYEPMNRDFARQGALQAFGRDVHTRYDFTKAKRVLSLDADFMHGGDAPVRYARDFMAGRRVRGAAGGDGDGGDIAAMRAAMNRLYVVETMPSVTGSTADHRFAATPDEIERIAFALARRLGVAVEGDAGSASDEDTSAPPWLDAVARDLERHGGQSIVIAGDHQPPVVHALAQAINGNLGNIGETVIHTEPIEARSEDHRASLKALCDAIDAGQVEKLFILGGNPVYDAPADFNFLERLRRVPLRIHHGLYFNETAYHCHWHLPATHTLETWTDDRAFDGTVTFAQPLIAPLYQGRSVHEVMSYILDAPNRDAHTLAQRYWKQRHGEEGFEHFWNKSLHDGVVPDTAAKVIEGLSVQSPLSVESPGAGNVRGGTGVSPVMRGRDARATASTSSRASASASNSNTIAVAIRPDPFILDGRFANNGWLQELPKPVTTLTWDNAVLLSPATAERFGVENEDVVKLTANEREVQGPVWIVPGHADDCATSHLGYGRNRAGKVGNGAGFDAYRLQTSDSPWLARDVRIAPGKGRVRLAVTQSHHQMEGRDLVRAGSLDDFAKDASLAPPAAHEPIKLSLYDDAEHETSDANQWGMVIDLGACTGCHACTAACQAENNIPVVGKEQVLVGREMHWIRVDRYYEGEADSPTAMHHQPLPCMHCENAPCEVVCPVNATVHSAEGLNDMVYNRCIGTRYCSNNCPYKVRRFNFLEYHDRDTDVLKLGRNPDVTVRSRGVMEKCTYCVQRISAARIDAKKNATGENPAGFVEDGAVVTACQQACPTQAITFGNLLDKDSAVSKLAAQPHNYGLLDKDLNTKPRTTYLGKVTNPNEELQ